MPGFRREKLHSAEFFGPERDYWWNVDQLELIASRLGAVRSVMDVGCGIGHWGRLLDSVLSSEATVIGVDREGEWVSQARAIAEKRGLAGRLRYEQGVAEELEFPDDSFDLVTCQTLLIHVHSPSAVIGEMLRVTKPGGVILAAEPNNRAHLLIATAIDAEAPIEDVLDLVRFALRCERGQLALGEGHSSVGDLVPGYLAEQGAVEITTFLCDKPRMLVAPYASEEQQVLRSYALQEAEQNRWVWARDDALRYFVAGGGRVEEFDAAWDRRLGEVRRRAAALTDGSFHTAGGNIHYLIAARRPSNHDPGATRRARR